ncbi:hypothetical protein UFOVP254_28 [uncultured Caudovirales phage]|uniref:DUF4157 domain-containing protein n=1 Tax=uncultured Caudovirales phage TaxID=2100421 RepID=A0A6J5LHG8_9CAUD|nr:hypothetical protein UFOVP76_25 [uncultured Caudovirales phage]CAB4133002.1 hypothetical protein UFOVP254_28 [uncultured Caudovirales phage]
MNPLAQLLLRLFHRDGITLPPWGIYWRSGFTPDERIVRHEGVHWAQYERMGAVRFYLTYLWYQMRYGYKNNPMEIEARGAE